VASRDEWRSLCKAFGAAVRARREELELSQEELGFRSGLDRTYVSGIERGVRNPTLKSVGRLAKALSTRPSRLLAVADRA
jgi:transcriptional regulator with XRE-family HTH domain